MSSNRPFFRSTIVKREDRYLPKVHESSANIKDLLNKVENSEYVDLSSFQSGYADQVLWGVPGVDNFSGGYYSVIVSTSRFIARYALDREFRSTVQQDPGKFAIVNAEYQVPEEDLYIFTEGSDMRLYGYKGNERKVEEGHLIAQRLDATSMDMKAVSIRDLGKAMGHLLHNDADSSMRLVDSLYQAVGFTEDEIDKLTVSTVLESDDGEERKWRTVVDSLNIAFQICQVRIRTKDLKVTEAQLIDLTARGLAEYFSLERFVPELIGLQEYESELQIGENQLPKIDPSSEIINRSGPESSA
jgi:hypothetical protein